ncbi:hypothetical protein [Larkinella knui]|uniref:Uncharacterized protein n=1 Tax=Larkinella knui TaxID=2025310 RepID=A0A3P1CY36_9BACT|nr:hypothetical protein [Larkinella knui]RRB18281.1 hypothetical protein EHT87_08415 [Larkinella knui]
MRFILIPLLAGTLGASYWYARYVRGPEPITTLHQGDLPSQTALNPTPRQAFTPTTRKGYWNPDVVGDFTLPATKSLTFSGAGRNLHVDQDWSKLFRRGFSSVDKTRMSPDEFRSEWNKKPEGWTSRLKPSQRALTIGQGYMADAPFHIGWSRSGDKASETWYVRPWGDQNYKNSVSWAMLELNGECTNFGDCPPDKRLLTYGKVFFDLENEGVGNVLNRQEQVNMYVFMMKTLRQWLSPYTEVGSIAPVPLNGYGYSRARDFNASAEWLWAMPAKHTETSRQRGMPDDIVGKTFADFVDFQMPGTYYMYPEFDYSITHNDDGARHWLGALLHEQEVNRRLSPKKRIAWQWLFNTQSSEFNNSEKAKNAAPPAIAEGIAVFYWFTGAYGALLWDDATDLKPDQPTPAEVNQQGLGNDRVYACYEHYVHGLWRLFKHHGDLFNGREKYLNEQTECSVDGGKTWYKYTANQMKTQDVPFVRAIVNGNQILVAATQPYGKASQREQVMVRYIEDGYQFYTTINLKGDEIYLGRATMPKAAGARKKA